MTKSAPVYHKKPTGQPDISALEQHQRRLSYGGGAFISAIIVLILIASIALSISDYKADQTDDFRKAKLALDSAFIQRDAGYVRTLNMIEYVWKNKADKLVEQGDRELPGFVAHDDQAVIQAAPAAIPWLVLGNGIENWPKDKTDRYLGLIHEMSVISGTSLTVRSAGPPALGYFYDPSEVLFAFGYDMAPPSLKASMERSDRAALFSKLVAPHVDFNNLQALQQLQKGNPVLPFYGKDLPKVLSTTGVNPSTGEPSIVGSMVAMDGDTPIGAFVVYEPFGPFINQIRKVSTQELTVVAEDGKVVFGTGTESRHESVATAIAPFLVVLPAEGHIATYHVGGRFYIAERIAGTTWTLVRTFSWSDILRGECTSIWVACASALLLLATLWFLLIRQYRSVFAPALARAKRVYQSEALNRTMIDTSPVGLCVIATKNAAPLLENDLVRGYASSTPDPDRTFYRQLLLDFGNAKGVPSGRPEAREFAIALPGDPAKGSRHLLVAAMPIVYRDRDALFCVLRDVTARIELEENLRRARQDSEQAKLAAESASDAKTSFVATMSHEIRTPLNGILGHLELLGRSHLDASQRERLGRIRLSADALLSIISDVLDFSRIEAGQLDIDAQPFELRSLIEQTALLYAPMAQRKGLTLYYGVESGLSAWYVADAHRIRQVLNNLVSNAVKFTESGRIILRVRRLPSPEGAPERLRFEVIDSGIGMTDAQREQVFQPFSQADASISRRFGGSGLGLTLCHQLAELMGGRIHVQSTPGVGSMFALELPVSGDELAHSPPLAQLQRCRIALLSAAAEWRNEISDFLVGLGAEVVVAALPSELEPDWVEQCDALVIFGAGQAWTEEEERFLVRHARRAIKAVAEGPLLPELSDGILLVSCYSSAALLAAILETEVDGGGVAAQTRAHGVDGLDVQQGGRVLLADDNPVNRELIQQQLETLGYQVESAEDGVAALRLWQHGRYEIVLTDINMPNMNGYELTRRLRAQGATLPILAVTATALTSEKARCKQAGINDLLLKPLSLDRLGEAMGRHLHAPVSSPAPQIKVAWAGKYPEKVFRIFIESGTRDLNAVLSATRAQDQDGLLARIHSMKGALLMLGEKEVAGQCATLERRIDAEGIRAALPDIALLEIAMRDLLRRYAELLNASDAREPG